MWRRIIKGLEAVKVNPRVCTSQIRQFFISRCQVSPHGCLINICIVTHDLCLQGWLACNINSLNFLPLNENTSERILCDRKFLWMIEIEDMQQWILQDFFYQIITGLFSSASDRSSQCLHTIIEFNHGCWCASDHKQSKQFSVLGFCLNSIKFLFTWKHRQPKLHQWDDHLA